MTNPATDSLPEFPDCPAERFASLPDAQAALITRRARAALSGSPHTVARTAYPCDLCGGAHLVRVTTPEGAVA